MENKKLQKVIEEQKNCNTFNIKLQQLFKFASWKINSQSKEITLSSEACSIFELEAQEATFSIKEFITSFTFKHDIQIINSELDIILKNKNEKKQVNHFEYRIASGKGDIKYIKIVYYRETENIYRGVLIDISDFKKSEINLHDSEAKVQTILHAMDDLVFVFDKHNRFISVNTSGKKLLVNPDDFLGKTHAEVMPTGVNKLFNEALKRAIKGEKASYDYSLELPDGVRWFSQKLSPIIIQKKYEGLVSVVRDITERIEAKEQLRKERDLFSDGPVCTMIWSPEKSWPVLYVSDNIHKILGYTSREMISSEFNYASLIHSEDIDRISLEMEMHRNNNVNSFEQSYRIKSKSGSYKWFYNFTKLVRNTLGKVIEVRGYIFDQSALMQANKALSLSEHNFRLLAEYNNDWEYWIDQNGKYVFISPACEKITGYKPEDFIHDPDLFLQIIRPDFVEFVKNHNHDESGKEEIVKYIEFPIISKSGREVWIEHRCSPVYDNGGKFAGRRGGNRDITKRKNVQENLRKSILKTEASEKRFRELFEKSSDANLIIENGLFTDCNESALKMLDYHSKTDLLNTHPSAVSPEFQSDGQASVDKANEMMQIALKEGSHRFEWLHEKKDGTVFPVEVLLIRIFKSSEKYVLHSVWRDISENKQFENELRLAKEKAEDTEAQFRAISEQSAEGITVADLDGKYIFVNPSFCKMSGYTVEELLNLSVFDMKAKNQNHNSFYDSKEKMQGIPIHVNLKKKDGTEYMTEIIGKIITVNNQQLVMGIIRDISERIKKEKEVIDAKNRAEKSEAQLRAIVDQSPLSIQIFNKDGLTISANDSWEKLWHSKKEQVIGKYNVLTDDYADEIGWLKYIKKAFGGETVYLSDMEYDPAKSGYLGRVRILDCIVFPIKLKGEVEQVVIIHQDITLKKEQDLELINAKERAEESDRLKSAFLANMSHEIRTPMNGILGFTSLLKEPDCTLTEQLEFISVIERSGFRLLGIINDLIDISKIESGLMDISKTKISVNEQLKYMFAFFQPEVESKKITLQLNELPTDQIIFTDKEKLLAILTNLIKNSIKYSNQGEIEFGYKINGNYLEFYIKDQGIGIAQDKLISIFDRFVQADNTLASSYEGAGLGLSITKAFVELLGGKIWVQSEFGIGTQFYFTLPIL